TDSDSWDDPGNRAIRAVGILVVPDQRAAIMHDKFVVVDGALVWTGSMNFTVSDAYHNHKHVLLIRSASLAGNYTRELERMFVGRRFGDHVRADLPPNPVVTINGVAVESYFSPKGDAAEHINDVLAGAHKTVYFMAFAFTRKDFGQTLLD